MKMRNIVEKFAHSFVRGSRTRSTKKVLLGRDVPQQVATKKGNIRSFRSLMYLGMDRQTKGLFHFKRRFLTPLKVIYEDETSCFKFTQILDFPKKKSRANQGVMKSW